MAGGGDDHGGADLIGRRDELAALTAALAEASSGTTSRIRIEGAPGTGKTALGRWTAARADGFLVLRVTCIEGEGRLGLAALVTLLRPLRRFVGDLTAASRSTLQGVLDGTGSRADPVALGASALALVARAAVAETIAREVGGLLLARRLAAPAP